MKARWTLTAVCVGLLALIAFPVAQADRDDDDDRNGVAGSYFFEGELLNIINPAEPPRTFNWLITLNNDGTFAADNVTDFGADTVPRFRSTQRGAWEWSGRREIVATSLSFDFGEQELGERGPENRNVSILRITTTIQFDRRFKQFQLDGVFEVFFVGPPNQDPLEDEPLLVPATIHGEGRRIPATFDDDNDDDDD